MAKSSGIGMTVTIDDASGTPRNISNDITNMSFGTPRGAQDVTGLDKSAMERLLLLADGTVSLNGVFNPTADKSHDVFKTVVSSAATRTVVIGLPGSVSLTLEVIFTEYTLSRAQDGSLTWTATGQLANGTAPAWS